MQNKTERKVINLNMQFAGFISIFYHKSQQVILLFNLDQNVFLFF